MRVILENMRVLTKLCVNHPRIYYNYVGEINVYHNVEMARDRFINSMRKIMQINFRHENFTSESLIPFSHTHNRDKLA